MDREYGLHKGKKIDFVDLGAMGFHMASNLITSILHVIDHSEEKSTIFHFGLFSH